MNPALRPRSRTLPLWGICAVAATLFVPPLARAHAPPTIYAAISVDAEEVTWKMVITASLLEAWFGLDAKEVGALEGDAWKEAKAKVEAFFQEWGSVRIDGVRVRGVLRPFEYVAFEDHSMLWEYVHLTMAFGAKGQPRQLALAWRNFDPGPTGWFDRIETEIDAFGETSYYVFREKEPGVVWHAPLTPPVTLARPPPRTEGPPRIGLPVISFGILGLFIVSLPLLNRQRVDHARGWALAAFALVLALGFADVARTEVELPLDPGFQRPSEEQAAYAFETLLRNTYRAFDYDSEVAIYDTLNETVSGDLLRDIYLEVYGSLILEEEGGAVCKVRKVELIEKAVTFPEDEHSPWYVVTARWRVHGKVGHWGHSHIRVNQYEAVFRVELEGDRWKIASMRVVEKERVDDPAGEWR